MVFDGWLEWVCRKSIRNMFCEFSGCAVIYMRNYGHLYVFLISLLKLSCPKSLMEEAFWGFKFSSSHTNEMVCHSANNLKWDDLLGWRWKWKRTILLNTSSSLMTKGAKATKLPYAGEKAMNLLKFEFKY